MKQNASVKEIQSINEFNSFFPMEVIATKAETDALTAGSKRKDYIIFPEDRLYPVKMKNRLPARWIQKGIAPSFTGKADKGENYTFQLAVYPLQDLENVSVSFSDLSSNGKKIAAKANCIASIRAVRIMRGILSQKK
jgi:hypothetical protein